MIDSYGELIRGLREECGLSQEQIANKLGISRSSYIAVEQGKRELTIGEFDTVSKTLGVTIEDLRQGEVPNYEKYKQMILAFLRLNKNVTKTKLAKLLYFADFGWYYSNLKSMSGLQYRKIQYGPVADAYFWLIDEMMESGTVAMTSTDDGAMLLSETRGGEKVELKKLSEEERNLIKEIDEKWKGKKTSDIVAFTHQQLPYLYANDNEIVSYNLFTQEDPDDIF